MEPRGQATDIDIHAKEILIMRERLNRLMASTPVSPWNQVIERDTERDRFMGAERARVMAWWTMWSTAVTPAAAPEACKF